MSAPPRRPGSGQTGWSQPRSPFGRRPAPANNRQVVPDLPNVDRALHRSEPLVSLMQRLRASQDCLEAVRSVLPPSMVAHVKAGPLDEDGWTLLAANSAVSAKLRQLQPRLIEALAAKGCKVTSIRVKVQKG
jgi:hypothetical protein